MYVLFFISDLIVILFSHHTNVYYARMDSSTITLIFILGGVTFLVNWYLTIFNISKRNQDAQKIQLRDLLYLGKLLIISIPGVLIVGIIFVSALLVSHG